ncbi:glycogen/starch/alpha-glucan phosphorylase [uncultured Anaerococcus sp.]|uniref:glycogen/starch/alpha-glucan phosphorylase n=1 Tax=Anaerococcus sp. AH8042_DFU013_CI05 TaxID=3385202 RepID=UPI0025EB285C|nr:glycogen/starch/alpha-glucan phosphorylase [uncultured Anaerococcus sp.]
MITNKEIIIERIQNYLYSFYAKNIQTARDNEIYDCLCRYLMEIIGKRWVDTKKIKEGYEVYILSFEYLPGRFLENVIYKLNLESEIRFALDEMGFSYDDIINYDPEPDLGIGDMGMGSSYLINELSNKKIKATAYALRYESGNFKQVIKDGMQKAESSSWIRNGYNWEHRKSFTNIIEIYGKKHKTITYDMPVMSDDASFINTLRLFKSEATQNINLNKFSKGDIIDAYDDYINNSSITEFLYVDDSSYEGKILRLKQEYFFSASAMRDFVRRYVLYYEDINNINKQTNVIINDIHPTLALIEFIRILTSEYNFSTKTAIKYTREIFYHLVFSITDDSLERYPIDEIRNMNPEILSTITAIQNELITEENFDPFIINGFVIFRNINIALSNDYIFLSKSLCDSRKNSRSYSYINLGTDRLMYAKSANRKLTNYLEEYKIDISNTEDFKKFNLLLSSNKFLDGLEEIKLENKKRLIRVLEGKEKNINPYSIFDMQLSIMHESKRQILNSLAIAYEFYYLRDNRNAYAIPKTYIFSGKANEGYFMAKETIKFILALKKLIESDKIIREKLKIIYVENLSVTDLRYLYPACDIYSNLIYPLYDNQNFDILNSILNMSNILTTKGGIVKNLDMENEFYLFKENYNAYEQRRKENSYNANNIINQNQVVKYTIENLLKESHENLPYDFKKIYDEIMLYNDSFEILLDLENLINLRGHISKDYLDKENWTKKQVKNILWANEFNLDHVKKDINFGKRL